MANNEKLDVVMDYIRANPEKHDQRRWVMEDECGTTACIAGWTAILLGGATGFDVDTCIVGHRRKSINKVASEILELTQYESSVLFHCRNDELETVISGIKQGLYS